MQQLNRRQRQDGDYRNKFDEFGLSEKFEFIRRDWTSDHGRKTEIRCKTCGESFMSWTPREVFRGKQSHLLCPYCGASSDGNDAWTRSKECNTAMEFYQQGHSVSETAERFGVTKAQINNLVKQRGLTNGRSFHEGAARCNEKRHKDSVKAFLAYLESGGKDYSHIRDTHKRRAIKYGCEYDPSVTREKLIEKNGLVCAICGGKCDMNDRSWGALGALYPTIDHITPMSKGGGHTWDNVQIAHAICNIIKSDNVDEVV